MVVGFGPVLTDSNGSTFGSMHKFQYFQTKKNSGSSSENHGHILSSSY